MSRVARCWSVALVVALLVASFTGSSATVGSPVMDLAWDRFDSRFTALAPRTNFLAAEVIDGRCEPVHALRSDQRLAVASTFKLYVLAELARQIEAGLVDWDEELPIQDHLKSMPSGNMLYVPPGTMYTLYYYAERMIAESDNTATDHLIDRLGRENVEAAQVALGHGAPDLNTPLLMTREFFTFKIALAPERIDAYLEASEAERRRILETEIGAIPLRPEEGWGDWNAPKQIDTIEWFASADDLCQALATLHGMSLTRGLTPLRRILSLNRGDIFDYKTWPYAGFKAGTEAGVYNLSWLLRRGDGRVFVLTASLNDPDNYIDYYATGQLMLAAFDLLAKTP